MDGVPVITGVIAKGLMLVERLLDEWVNLGGEWTDIPNENCGPEFNLTVEMEECGNDFVELLEDLLHGGLEALITLMGGLVATESYPG
jgi:hypothetical protein